MNILNSLWAGLALMGLSSCGYVSKEENFKEKTGYPWNSIAVQNSSNKWVNLDSWEKVARDYLTEKGVYFGGKHVGTGVYINCDDDKRHVIFSYGQNIGERYWLVTLNRDMKVVDYETSIGREGPGNSLLKK